VERVGASGFWLVAAVVAVAAVAGCRTSVEKSPLPAVRVEQRPGARPVSPAEAGALRMTALKGRLRAAHEAGDTEQVTRILKEMAVLARSAAVDIPAPPHERVTTEPARVEPTPVLQPPLPAPTPTETPEPKPEARAPVREPISPPKAADQLVSVNFNEVDIRVVVQVVAELTGKNFIIDDRVRGTVTVISPTKISVPELYDVLQSILDVKGYAAVEAGRMIKILPRAEATKRNRVTRVGKDPAAIPQSDTVVTQIIPLKYVRAAEIERVLRPMLPPGSQMSSYAPGNRILITDTSANIHQMARIIAELDVAEFHREISAIQLKHTPAVDFARKVTEILQEAGPTAGTARAAGGATNPGKVRVFPDERTNSVLVVGNRAATGQVRRLAEIMDLEVPLGEGRVHVVYLQHSDGERLAPVVGEAIRAMEKGLGGDQGARIQVTADKGTNALVVVASPQDFRAVEAVIRKLDVPRQQVLVEMVVVEVTADKARAVGVDWATLDPASGGIRGFAATDFGVRVEQLSGGVEGFAVGAFKAGPEGAVKIAGILKAFQKDSHVNVLATPRILTSNNEEADILVGENIPVIKESRITETDVESPTVIRTFDYRDVGISLKIKPQINRNRRVRLSIDTEITQVIESARDLGPETPTTAKRTARTVVSVGSGRTIVIGGLIRDDKQRTVRKVPLLGDIPLLGWFFRRTDERVVKTNLLIFITPHVLGGEDTACDG